MSAVGRASSYINASDWTYHHLKLTAVGKVPIKEMTTVLDGNQTPVGAMSC